MKVTGIVKEPLHLKKKKKGFEEVMHFLVIYIHVCKHVYFHSTTLFKTYFIPSRWYFSFIVSPSKLLSFRRAGCPDQWGLVGWASCRTMKDHQSHSWSGHLPGLQVWSQVRTHMRGNWLMFLSMFLFLFPSLPLSPKINKNLEKKEGKEFLFCSPKHLRCPNISSGWNILNHQ